MDTAKKCIECGQTCPFESFALDASSKDGRYNTCKQCAIQRIRRFDQSNPDAVRHRKARRRARRKNAAGTHTLAEWRALCESFENTCLRCGATDEPLTRDHILPLVRGGTDSVDNLQPLCQPCNRAKGLKATDYRAGAPMSEQRRPGARRKVDLRQAAEILDTSVDAVRKRISRGTLEGEKGPDGKLYTWLDLDQTANPEDASLSALVEAKDETIELLRQQLEQEREANRENRRLLAAALERIPELTAPEEASSETAPEPRESPETAADEPGRDDVPQEQQEPSQRRSWWREFFGLE